MCAATSHQLRRRQLYTAPSACSAVRAPCTKQPRACSSGGSRTRNSDVSLRPSAFMRRTFKEQCKCQPQNGGFTLERPCREVNVCFEADERLCIAASGARASVDTVCSSAQVFAAPRLSACDVALRTRPGTGVRRGEVSWRWGEPMGGPNGGRYSADCERGARGGCGGRSSGPRLRTRRDGRCRPESAGAHALTDPRAARPSSRRP